MEIGGMTLFFKKNDQKSRYAYYMYTEGQKPPLPDIGNFPRLPVLDNR